MKIRIHYDFKDGTELPYGEAIKCTTPFTTNCLEFFKSSNPEATLCMKNGKEISVQDLLDHSYKYSNKIIRKEHDFHRLLIGGVINSEEEDA